MLESLPIIIIVGTILGFLSGLGIGGGSLLIIWLTTVLGKDPLTARCMNLMFFIPSAIVATCIRRNEEKLDLRTPLPAIFTGCIFAVMGWWMSTILDTALLKKLFGAVLLLTGIRELFYRPRKAK